MDFGTIATKQYRARLKGGAQVWQILFLLLLTTSAWLCIQHSHNLAEIASKNGRPSSFLHSSPALLCIFHRTKVTRQKCNKYVKVEVKLICNQSLQLG